MQHRKKIIQDLPSFANFTPKQLEEFAALFDEVVFLPQDRMVIENEPVDSVFIIEEGIAEISKQPKMLLGMMCSGDVIGLNEMGFFSQTGERTATVTALTDIKALKIELKTLHGYLKKHPNAQQNILEMAERMLRMNLIRSSLPFTRLSQERLMQMANKVQEKNITENSLIFKKGDQGDECYLIAEGEIEILDDENQQHEIALLRPPALFGEATFITRSVRNATARAKKNSKLLVIQYQDLSELLETEKDVKKMFMTLMIDRSRPIKNPNIVVYERSSPEGKKVFILKNPENNAYFKLSEESGYLWDNMHGDKTMHQLTMLFSEKFNIFAPHIITSLISKLAKNNFITNVIPTDYPKMTSQSLWVKGITLLRRIVEARYAFGDADRWLSKLYDKGGFLFFNPMSIFLFVTIIITGLIAFGFASTQAAALFQSIKNGWILLFLLVPFGLLAACFHELGHALTTKAYGHEVHYMGIGWYWLSPVAFTDTSEMWLSSRWPRVMVNLGGVFSDFVLAGTVSLLFFVINQPYIQAFLWLWALWTYINIFRHLNPIQELDGYYIMMDLFDRPNLRRSAVHWLLHQFPNCLKKPVIRNNMPEVIYWFACILFILLASLITYLIQHFVFKILNIVPGNPFVSFALPVLVAFLSTLSIVAEIRQTED